MCKGKRGKRRKKGERENSHGGSLRGSAYKSSFYLCSHGNGKPLNQDTKRNLIYNDNSLP